MNNQVVYCGHKVDVYPANKGQVRLESPIFKQTLSPSTFLPNAHMISDNKKYSCIIDDTGEVHKGYKLSK